MTPAVLGFRVHSGWAAMVAVTAGAGGPVVVDRRRVEMADPKLDGAVQPYHAAEGRPIREASSLIQRLEASARKLAAEGLAAATADLARKGYEPAGAVILLAAGRPLPALPAILASHALIHTADGEHFRDALAAALTSRGVPLHRIRERDLTAEAEQTLGRPASELLTAVAALKRTVGAPWTQDQKLPALAGWLALAGLGSERAAGRPARKDRTR